MSMTRKTDYANLRSNSTGKITTSNTAQPVLSRYLTNSTGSCHDRCKHVVEECSTTGNTCPQTKFRHSTTQPGHKARISIFKRIYHRKKFVLPTAAASVSPTQFVTEKARHKYLYILPSNGAKNIVGPIKQKGDSSPWLPSRPAKNKLRCLKKDTRITELLPSPRVEKSRRRAEIRAQCGPSASSAEMTCTNPRIGDDMDKFEEKRQLHFFKRGKVIDPRGECSIMWRLKFRKPREIDDRQYGVDIDRRRRRSYKRVEASTAQKNSKSERILLKHCKSEEEGEKDQSLLNNMIEQTASKLVESRKSKVKALVGAFETVISLQLGEPRLVVKAC